MVSKILRLSSVPQSTGLAQSDDVHVITSGEKKLQPPWMILTAIDLLLCQKLFDRNVRVGHRKGHFQDVTGDGYWSPLPI